MKGRGFILVAAAVLLLGGGTALAAGSFDVYVSNPELGQIWKVPYDGAAWGSPVLLFEGKKIKVQDLVVGPDDSLYACAPDNKLVFSFDPAAVVPGSPLNEKSTAVIKHYEGKTSGPVAPQCGWFSDRGDLFLTDRLGDTAVWIYRNLVPLYPGTKSLEPFVPTSAVNTGFFGQGVTQGASGDLLFVDNANKKVWSLGFDPIFRFNQPANPNLLKSPTALTLGTFSSPVGIARTAFDDLYITDGAYLRQYPYNRDTGMFDTGCFYPFSGFTARFLAFTSDDRLFVAATSSTEANLWQVDAATCQPVGGPILTFAKPAVNKPAMSGVAVSRTSRDGASTSSTGYYYFNFKDHAYELTLNNASCSVAPTVTAQEMPPECLANLINCYVEDGENQTNNLVTGVPVTYAGDGGMAQLYTVDGTCSGETIGHAISAYTDLVKNPRIVRCTDPPAGVDICAPCNPITLGDEFCQIIDVASFFPFNGVFPDDGRIEGSRTATDFSEYFFADIDLSTGVPGQYEYDPGCFCAWESPLPNVYLLNTTNPFTDLPVYNAGSSVPLKFRVAQTDGTVCGDNGVDYCATPDYGYVTGARVLLSVAQIFSGSATSYTETFAVKDPRQTNGDEWNEFGNPNNPSTPYHYNLDTSGYAPGIYQAVALALTDNFAVEWTYFAVR